MDSAVAKQLQDKLYDKRKAGALELESIIRNALHEGNHNKIAKIVHQLCHDYAYAVHQPHARNGGLIGLAAAAIALGLEVARYLKEIVPPVLACFSDQDARVRYYACESMYNIAKVAKGEVLVYFNDVFDALCKLAADTELSVKNGAELLDRLVKDIVSESAATYTTSLALEPLEPSDHSLKESNIERNANPPKAFSLARFIPLLKERIHVLNPFVRTFLVSWITLLDSIPDLELVVYLPSFLGGLLKFLGDPNPDVHTITKVALDRFLTEIKRISALQKGLAEIKRTRASGTRRVSEGESVISDAPKADDIDQEHGQAQDTAEVQVPTEAGWDPENLSGDETSITAADDNEEVIDDDSDGEWIPGQDVQIDHQHILEILVTFLSESREEDIQVIVLQWIEAFLDICPEDILLFTPKLLGQLLPALSHDVDHVRQAASRVNQALMSYIMSLPEDTTKSEESTAKGAPLGSTSSNLVSRITNFSIGNESRKENSNVGAKLSKKSALTDSADPRQSADASPEPHVLEMSSTIDKCQPDLDYEAAVSALTDQFIHQYEATRVAALAWLIMLHRKSPRKIMAIQEATFPALLKTLSDPSEAVVTRDLLLLSQISKSSDDSYFSAFMINLLKLFCTDRRLLATRGNLIIRQLCLNLSAEKIYRTMADCLERDADEDAEFASIMVQNLNNNLITAPELADLRKRLRNLDSREGQIFFTVLFRAWCVNAVATFSLCLLAQAYEQAYELLKVFTELEMTVNHLIQIDKLVQLLESPVFTYLRMQLLEPERYPFLYKCMYGVLMLLPQSSAFAALKNRLNSVSAIGYLHIVPRATSGVSATGPGFERPNRLKSREVGDGGIRWTELLEKFRATQDRVRQQQYRHQFGGQEEAMDEKHQSSDLKKGLPTSGKDSRPDSAASSNRPASNIPTGVNHTKAKSSLGHLSRFANSVAKGKAKDKK